ncbi:MAG: hypothetical protein ACD_12C00005G0003 [uncultured bacterium]|nr:MAG: hypothetical protein ACD_12C00005G0003 [uncultured bacterium]
MNERTFVNRINTTNPDQCMKNEIGYGSGLGIWKTEDRIIY